MLPLHNYSNHNPLLRSFMLKNRLLAASCYEQYKQKLAEYETIVAQIQQLWSPDEPIEAALEHTIRFLQEPKYEVLYPQALHSPNAAIIDHLNQCLGNLRTRRQGEVT